MSYFVKIRVSNGIQSFGGVEGYVQLCIMDTVEGVTCQMFEVYCRMPLVGPLMEALRSGKDVCLELNEDSELVNASDIHVEITDGMHEAWLNSVLPIEDDSIQF